MSNKKIKGEAKRRAAVRAAGAKRSPGALQWIHDMFDNYQAKRTK